MYYVFWKAYRFLAPSCAWDYLRKMVRLPPGCVDDGPGAREEALLEPLRFVAEDEQCWVLLEHTPGRPPRIFVAHLAAEQAPQPAAFGAIVGLDDVQWLARTLLKKGPRTIVCSTMAAPRVRLPASSCRLADETGEERRGPPEPGSFSPKAPDALKLVLSGLRAVRSARWLRAREGTRRRAPAALAEATRACGSLCAIDIEAGHRGSTPESTGWEDVRELAFVFLDPLRGMLQEITWNRSATTALARTELVEILQRAFDEHRTERILGHNIEAWDLPILRRTLPEITWPRPLDTLRMARMLIPSAPSHALDSLRKAGMIEGFSESIGAGQTHSALTDALDALGLFAALSRGLDHLPAAHRDLVRYRLDLGSSVPRVEDLLGDVAAAEAARHRVGADGTAEICPLEVDRETVLLETQWKPTAAALGAENAILKREGRGFRLVLAPSPAPDSPCTWSPPGHRVCARSAARLGLSDRSREIDSLAVLPFATSCADVRLLRTGNSTDDASTRPAPHALGRPPEGCGGCALDGKDVCAVQRAERQRTVSDGLVALGAMDLRDWLMARPSGLGTRDGLWLTDARAATRTLIRDLATSWRATDVPGLGAFWKKLRAALETSEHKHLSTARVAAIWHEVRAEAGEGAARSEDRLLQLLNGATDRRGDHVLHAELEDGVPVLVAEPSSAGRGLLQAIRNNKLRISVVLDSVLTARLRLNAMPTALPIAFALGIQEDAPVIKKGKDRPRATLRIYNGRLLPSRGPLAIALAAREALAFAVARAQTAHAKVCLALSVAEEAWPEAPVAPTLPAITIARSERARRAVADFLLNPAPGGAVLVIRAGWLLREPNLLEIPDAIGRRAGACSEVLLDRLPYDLGDHHRLEEAQFQQRFETAHPDWSYRFDVRLPLALLQIQRLAHELAVPTTLLDRTVLDGTAGSAITDLFEIGILGDDGIPPSVWSDVAKRLAPATSKRDVDALLARAEALLGEVFGFPRFLEYDRDRTTVGDSGPKKFSQIDILRAVFEGRDALAVLPTGGGKSLAFQIPALVAEEGFSPGLTVVVSPLIALMQDMVRNLRARGVFSADYFNSELPGPERTALLDRIRTGSVNIVFCAPEQFRGTALPKAIQTRRAVLLAVDEAHCISQWGHDFRTDYLFVPDFAEEVMAGSARSFPVLALTATARRGTGDADGDTQGDIVARLRLRDDRAIFVAESVRGDLDLDVIDLESWPRQGRPPLAPCQEDGVADAQAAPDGQAAESQEGEDEEGDGRDWPHDHEKLQVLVGLLTSADEPCMAGKGIVYCAFAAVVRRLARTLARRTRREVRAYFGQLDPAEKRAALAWFAERDKPRVIVATNAFGMGVDVADIRFVVHWDHPASLEHYYQEVGRAGRDRCGGRSILLYSPADERKHRLLAQTSEIDEGMIRLAWRTIVARAARRDGAGDFLLPLEELGRAAGAPADGGVGNTLLFYFEHFAAIGGQKVLRRRENIPGRWIVRIPDGSGEPTDGLDAELLRALRQGCGPGIDTAEGDRRSIIFGEWVAADRRRSIRETRLSLVRLMKQGLIVIEPEGAVISLLPQPAADRRVGALWDAWREMIPGLLDEVQRTGGFNLPHDPRMGPDAILAMIGFCEVVHRTPAPRRHHLRRNRVVWDRGEQPDIASGSDNPTRRRFDELRSSSVAPLPGERRELSVKPFLDLPADRILQRLAERDAVLVLLERAGVVALERRSSLERCARVTWLGPDPSSSAPDMGRLRARLRDVKRLASRKLAVLHQFAVLPKSERAAFIGAYFNGTQRIERPPKDLDTWRKRLASIGDRQVAEDQRRAIFDERFSASYVIEGLGGTGKTEVIARRYLALHMIFEVAEDEILLVSAHHQSLGVLQQRIVDVSAGYARAPQARTVHSLAERIVRQFAAHLPFSPPLHDTKEAAAKQRLCQILSQFTELPLAVIEEGFDALTREIHRATLAGDYPGDRWAPWRECGFAPHNPRAWRDVSPNKKSPPVAASALIAAAKAYDNWKNENRLWDFDDRLTFASALLPKLERDGVLEWARIGWSHVLIDEAQDIPWTGTRFSSRLSQDFLGMWRSIRISSS